VHTRWRDFGDIWALARRHPVAGSDLQRPILEVAKARGATLAPLADVLDGYPEVAQTKWAAWWRRAGADPLPEQFTVVLDGVLRFADQPLRAEVSELTWAPDTGTRQN